MTLFKRIELDLEAEEIRIKRTFRGTGAERTRQRRALLKLNELVAAGKWQEAIDHVRDKTAFPYNEKGEYPEQEHVGLQVSDLLHDLAHYNYYTQDQLLEAAKKKLKS